MSNLLNPKIALPYAALLPPVHVHDEAARNTLIRPVRGLFQSEYGYSDSLMPDTGGAGGDGTLAFTSSTQHRW
ncbi:hypothetical protein SUDANB43_04288 [Streptomyces sp. enrichment culture]